MTRNLALKKLQISLADFRRLCILKGVYPREPRNKKKANKGSTAPKTYYYTKDIQFLLHEPVLAKFREHKVFLRKLAKAMGKGQHAAAKNLEEQRPVYSLDHIVKERYPTFIDALRDLDDALSLVTLFASLPSSDRVPSETIEKCRLLAAEFQHIVLHTHALKKSFLSIKGIYYAAEIKGQETLWVVPWRFSTPVPTDVDLRVLLTFLEFYTTLLRFVNFKLYNEAGLSYPPRVDADRDEGDWLELGKEKRGEVVKEVEKRLGEQREKLRKGIKEVESGSGHSNDARIEAEKAKERIKTLEAKLGALIAADDAEEADGGVRAAIDRAAVDASSMSATKASTVPVLAVDQPDDSTSSGNGVFSGLTIYLNRETPIPSLLFVLRSAGAQAVGYPSPNSPINERDPRITHQIVDRDTIPDRVLGRAYIQPQWVFDSLNAGTLLDPTPYGVGKLLPPHLSPFVKADKDGYDPTQRAEVALGSRGELGEKPEGEEEGSEDEVIEEDEDEEIEEDEEEEESEEEEEEVKPAPKPKAKQAPKSAFRLPSLKPGIDLSDTATMNALELEAETLGLSSAEFTAEIAKFKSSNKKRAAPTEQGGAKKKAKTEEEEKKELAKMMMSRKDRQLYERMMFGKERKKVEVSRDCRACEAVV